jgi:hypothetical protein
MTKLLANLVKRYDYPFAERLKKPTVASSPCGDMHILADRFKVLVSAYQAAGTL